MRQGDLGVERARLERSIRTLELELGLREWDKQDDREAATRLLAQIRYVDPEGVQEFIAAEKARLTASPLHQSTV